MLMPRHGVLRTPDVVRQIALLQTLLAGQGAARGDRRRFRTGDDCRRAPIPVAARARRRWRRRRKDLKPSRRSVTGSRRSHLGAVAVAGRSRSLRRSAARRPRGDQGRLRSRGRWRGISRLAAEDPVRGPCVLAVAARRRQGSGIARTRKRRHPVREMDVGVLPRRPGRYARLDRAKLIDADPRAASGVVGLFQIMGMNHVVAGFADVDAFVAAMNRSEAAHLEAFSAFLEGTRFGGNSLRDLLAARTGRRSRMRTTGPATGRIATTTSCGAPMTSSAHRSDNLRLPRTRAARPTRPSRSCAPR